MRRILRVDVGKEEISSDEVPEKYRHLGGRGLTSTIIADEVNPRCHPLGPNNKIVLAPGIVSGTSAPSSGRMSVGTKSPLTGTIKESNVGGVAAQKMAWLDVHAVVIEGPEPDGSYLLKIDEEGAELISGDEYEGMGLYEFAGKIRDRFGDVGIIGIGPAGEMKLRNAGISVTDIEGRPGRYAGRGGTGAVLGSKGIKAIILDDSRIEQDVDYADRELFEQGRKKLTDALMEHPTTSETLPTYGTAALVNVINEAGALPTRNFTSGRFEGAYEISGEKINELAETRGGEGKVGHPCHPGCVIRCSNVVAHEDGSHHVAPLEYETLFSLGSNCGIDNIDHVAELNRICNDVGLDTIEAGTTLGVLMDAGVIDFGDGEAAIELLKEVYEGSPMGRIIGNGTEYAAEAYGVTRVPTVKGQSIPAYDPRAIKGIGITYATTTMGADHTAGYTIAPEILGVGGEEDQFEPDKAGLSRAFQAVTAFVDSTGYCIFITFATLDIDSGTEGLIETVNGVLGTSYTVDSIAELGQKIVDTERRFNKRAGFTKEHDRLPEFFDEEAIEPHDVTWDVEDGVLDEVHRGEDD